MYEAEAEAKMYEAEAEARYSRNINHYKNKLSQVIYNLSQLSNSLSPSSRCTSETRVSPVNERR